jgi:hypothetical protein
MVQHFNAAIELTIYVGSLGKSLTPDSDTISIAILSPPLPDNEMLSWTELLESDRFFPTKSWELPGKDFIEFLTSTNNYNVDVPTKDNIKKVTESAQMLREKLQSDPLVPDSDILTEIDTLAQLAQEAKEKCTSIDWYDVVEKILALKDFKPQDRLPRMETIVEMLSTFSNIASFYVSLNQGSLHFGTGFNGKYHCEASIASLLTSGHSGRLNDFEEWLNTLPEEEINQPEIKALLDGIKASHIFMYRLNLC